MAHYQDDSDLDEDISLEDQPLHQTNRQIARAAIKALFGDLPPDIVNFMLGSSRGHTTHFPAHKPSAPDTEAD